MLRSNARCQPVRDQQVWEAVRARAVDVHVRESAEETA